MYAVLHENFISIAVRVYTYIKKEKKYVHDGKISPRADRYAHRRISLERFGRNFV